MDQRTRELRAVKRERRRHRRSRYVEWGVDLIIVGLIMFIAGFCVGVAWVSLAVHHHH